MVLELQKARSELQVLDQSNWPSVSVCQESELSQFFFLQPS